MRKWIELIMVVAFVILAAHIINGTFNKADSKPVGDCFLTEDGRWICPDSEDAETRQCVR